MASRIVSRTGNFHLSLPQVLKVALPALDSTLQAIGYGKAATPGTTSGARTRAASFYELFYPRGTYLLENQKVLGAANLGGLNLADAAWIIPGDYDATDSTTLANRSEETIINVLPGQMTAFASLYKKARVERTEFHFKFTNLGPAAIIGAADAPTGSLQSTASGSVNHLLVTLPQSQWTATFSNNTVGGPTPAWTPDSHHSDSNSAQLAELPGSVLVTSSQDGNREIIHVRRSFDNSSKQAGDTIRSETWMTSDDLGTEWTIPAVSPNDPVLGVIGTSSLLDQVLISQYTNLTEAQRNCWFRYNEHVHVRYHITFWEPKTPQITFS